MFNKKTIIQKTISVAQSTLASRILGLIREALMLNYLTPGIITDAFITAFKIPNSLRKIFAEGALSAALIPTFITLKKKTADTKETNSLITLSLLVFEGILLCLCFFIFYKATLVINVIAPGWNPPTDVATTSSTHTIVDTIKNFLNHILQQPPHDLPIVTYAVSFLRILMPLIVFLSISALLASALQSHNHFFVPAFGQVVINAVFILGLVVCMFYQLSTTWLCWFIVLGCFLSLLMHIITYFKMGFSFGRITPQAWISFKQVLHKFLPCLLSMSVMEIHLFIDTSLGSFLPEGSISLIYYANRFMGIPLGVFAVTFSTILLPHFAHIGTYAPKRLSFYLLESAKFIWWVTVPVSLFLIFVSEKLFSTLSTKFSVLHIQQAGLILTAFVIGLFFFSLNKILLNIYYALHNTSIPFYISAIITLFNFLISYYYLMPTWGAVGIALSTTCAGILQTLLFVAGLHKKFNIKIYVIHFIHFVLKNMLQLGSMIILFLAIYYSMQGLLIHALPSYTHLLLNRMAYWAWVGPIAAFTMWFMLTTRRYFDLNLYFLD